MGDVEITLLTEENTITCYEMKNKAVLKTDIEKGIEKIGKHSSRIDNYIFITTEPIDREVNDYAKSLYREMGTEIVILDCIGSFVISCIFSTVAVSSSLTTTKTWF